MFFVNISFDTIWYAAGKANALNDLQISMSVNFNNIMTRLQSITLIGQSFSIIRQQITKPLIYALFDSLLKGHLRFRLVQLSELQEYLHMRKQFIINLKNQYNKKKLLLHC